MIESFAPLPVFFEGWASTPRDQIVDYLWDFGAGTEDDEGGRYFHGFNAAHVYETPGNYTVTLTIRDVFDRKATTAFSDPITVLEPDGTVYYADADIGDDAYDGTSATVQGGGVGPWKTATHVFNAMGSDERRYGPGDRILFKRGQTFDVVGGEIEYASWRTGYGYTYGAYGEGDKPIIKLSGSAPFAVINGISSGLAYVTWSDLVFDLTSTEEATADFYVTGGGRFQNVLWLRCEVRNVEHGFILQSNYCSGVFLVGCTIADSAASQIFTTCTRLALVNNRFERSNNHLAYVEVANRGVISGNTFLSPRSDRHALRICGHDGTPTTSNVLVTNNTFTGYTVPGSTYNWLLVHIGPEQRQRLSNPRRYRLREQHAAKRRNTSEHRQRREYRGPQQRHERVRYDQRPPHHFRIQARFRHNSHKERHFTQNVLTVLPSANPELRNAALLIKEYDGSAYEGRNRHENLRIDKNVVRMPDGFSRLLWHADTDTAQLAEVYSDNQILVSDSDDPRSKSAAARSWARATSTASKRGERRADTMPGPKCTKPTCPYRAGPRRRHGPTTAHTRALLGREASEGNALAEVRLWVKKDEGAWEDTGLTATWEHPWTGEATTGDVGFFEYNDLEEGVPTVCRFALQATDGAGHVSPAPVGHGHCVTLYCTEPAVNVTPAEVSLFVSDPAQTTPLAAASTDLLDTWFRWESDDESVAIVTPSGAPLGATASITAVGKGTATITCSGAVSGVQGAASVSVRPATWHDTCQAYGDFESQASDFTALGQSLGWPTDFALYDIELGVGDGVPDAWQLALLAYALCEEGAYDPEQGGVDGATVNADFTANAAQLDAMAADLGSSVAFFASAGQALTEVAASISETPCDGERSDPATVALAESLTDLLDEEPPLPAVPSVLLGAVGDLMLETAALANVLDAVPDLREILTGLLGLSSEMQETLLAELFLVERVQALTSYVASLAALAGAVDTECVQGIPDPALSTAIADLVVLLGTAPEFTAPDFAIYGADVGYDPFSGLGDYSGDTRTNREVAEAVQDANGDVDDFVAGATGRLGPFWNGNPNLPVVSGLTPPLAAIVVAGCRCDPSLPTGTSRLTTPQPFHILSKQGFLSIILSFSPHKHR